MTTLLQFENVSFAFGQQNILDRVSFHLEEGCCAALIGPNGVGKTTLLRLSAGLLRWSSGYISVGGQAVTGLRRLDSTSGSSRSWNKDVRRISVCSGVLPEKIKSRSNEPWILRMLHLWLTASLMS